MSPGPLDAKAVSGLSEYARTWPGDIVVVTPHEEAQYSEFKVESVDEVAHAVQALKPDVITALHKPQFSYLTEIGPTVYTSEVTRRIRTELQCVTGTDSIDKARIALGQYRLERAYRSMARSASGLQCNGYAAWKAYGRLNRSAIRFREHRITAADLAAAKVRSRWDGSRPLRVAFSGRVTAIKGPQLFIETAARMPTVDFTVIGEGDLRPQLERIAPDNVRFVGHIPFEHWPEYVRREVDVALLPHPQGDPSGTYHEMLGCGVPVVGLSNATWKYLAEHEGLGWVARSVPELARILSTLTPTRVDKAREHALALIQPYETVAAARVRHLVDVARA